MVIYNLSNHALHTLSKDHRKSTPLTIFSQHELTTASDSVLQGFFASQGSCVYELESAEAVDFKSKLEIGLCQFTPILVRIQGVPYSSEVSPATHLFGFKLSR